MFEIFYASTISAASGVADMVSIGDGSRYKSDCGVIERAGERFGSARERTVLVIVT